MNILYIDHYAGSKTLGRSFRPYYLGREWNKLGCQLTVIGGSYSHLRTINPKPGVVFIDDIHYIWLWTPKYKENGIGRILSMLIFMFQLFINIPRIIKIAKPDTIIASTVYMLDIFPAWLIKKLMRNRPQLIFELHDIWPMSPMQIGNLSRYSPYILFLRLVEKFVYKFSDKVASILPNGIEYIKKFGISQNKLLYVPNGVVIEEWEENKAKKHSLLKKHLKTIQDIKNKGFFLLGYAGAHSLANGLENLINAAKLLKSQNIYLILIGDGNKKLYLQEYAKINNIQNITFFDTVPKEIIPELIKQFDVLYIGLNKLPVFEYGISPNKIFDYMMSGRPIISAIESKFNPVDIAGCGFTVKPQNPQELANVIIQISKKSKNELDIIGAAGRKFVMKHHSYNKIANSFLNFIKKP